MLEVGFTGFPRLLESPGFFGKFQDLETGKSWKNILENHGICIGSSGKHAAIVYHPICVGCRFRKYCGRQIQFFQLASYA